MDHTTPFDLVKDQIFKDTIYRVTGTEYQSLS